MTEQIQKTKLSREEIVAKAKATRLANIALRESNVLEPAKSVLDPVKTFDVFPDDSECRNVWLQGMLTSIQTNEIRHPSQLKSAVSMADAILAEFKQKFEPTVQ